MFLKVWILEELSTRRSEPLQHLHCGPAVFGIRERLGLLNSKEMFAVLCCIAEPLLSCAVCCKQTRLLQLPGRTGPHGLGQTRPWNQRAAAAPVAVGEALLLFSNRGNDQGKDLYVCVCFAPEIIKSVSAVGRWCWLQ